MTEAEWRESGELRTMLEFIRQRTSGRKFRLFAVACVSELRHLLVDVPIVAALETARRFADGQADRRELLAAEAVAFELARTADLRATASDPTWAAARAAARAATLDPFAAAMGAAYVSALAHVPWEFAADGRAVHQGDEVARAAVRRRQCDLLREIVGNPFRPGWLSAEWLRWNDEIVARLAAEIFQTGRYEELPVLADALEDAGCDCRDLLDHLRRPGGHVHGCWALDLLLGR